MKRKYWRRKIKSERQKYGKRVNAQQSSSIHGGINENIFFSSISTPNIGPDDNYAAPFVFFLLHSNLVYFFNISTAWKCAEIECIKITFCLYVGIVCLCVFVCVYASVWVIACECEYAAYCSAVSTSVLRANVWRVVGSVYKSDNERPFFVLDLHVFFIFFSSSEYRITFHFAWGVQYHEFQNRLASELVSKNIQHLFVYMILGVPNNNHIKMKS